MHPINKLLSVIGVQINRTKKLSPEFRTEYKLRLKQLRDSETGFEIFSLPFDDTGSHPHSYIDYECTFASRHLSEAKPKNILDIGSYRYFILGLIAHTSVTTIDIRSRENATPNERVVTCDAKALDIPTASFDAVVSLCALEHFGLGRYGDEFDIEGDKKAFRECIRVLKPGGQLIFSTTITRARPSLVFNAHRIYTLNMIRDFCKGMSCLEENFYSQDLQRLCAYEHITDKPSAWDVYLGCWVKNSEASLDKL